MKLIKNLILCMVKENNIDLGIMGKSGCEKEEQFP